MGLLNNVGKKITSVTQNTVNQAKDFAEIAKLNSQICSEKKIVNDLYFQLGEIYFKNYSSAPLEESTQLCALLKEHNLEISALRNEIIKLKKLKLCTKCGAECDISASFCSSCGQALPVGEKNTKKFCKGCGTELSEEALFCSVCGMKND